MDDCLSRPVRSIGQKVHTHIPAQGCAFLEHWETWNYVMQLIQKMKKSLKITSLSSFLFLMTLNVS